MCTVCLTYKLQIGIATVDFSIIYPRISGDFFIKTNYLPCSFRILSPIMSKEIVVSGIRSTGFLHLGNYFGAMQNYVKMQDDYPCYFFVADYHSLTTHPDPKDLKSNVFRVVAENIACGLDPEKGALYTQTDL